MLTITTAFWHEKRTQLVLGLILAHSHGVFTEKFEKKVSAYVFMRGVTFVCQSDLNSRKYPFSNLNKFGCSTSATHALNGQFLDVLQQAYISTKQQYVQCGLNEKHRRTEYGVRRRIFDVRPQAYVHKAAIRLTISTSTYKLSCTLAYFYM